MEDVYDDNLDINIITSTGDVYFGTLFTLANINQLMFKDQTSYFWATNMIIVIDLKKETIREAIKQIYQCGYLIEAFTNIGTIKTVYSSSISFNELEDMT